MTETPHCLEQFPCQDLEEGAVYVALRGKLVESPTIDVLEGTIPDEPDDDPLSPVVTYSAQLKVDAGETIFDVSRLSTDLHVLQIECRAIIDTGRVRLKGSMHNAGDPKKPYLLVHADEWSHDGEVSDDVGELALSVEEELAEVFREGVVDFWHKIPEDRKGIVLHLCRSIIEFEIGDEPSR